ncbi:MAG: serine hydrolase [Planctomycetota bacterium]
MRIRAGLRAVAIAGSIVVAGENCLAVTPPNSVRHPGEQRSVTAPRDIKAIYYPMAPRRGTTSADAPYPEDVLQQFLDYHSAMQYELSAECALRLIELAPERPIGHYNLACALTRLNRFDEALRELDRAVELGWRNQAHLLIDPDLASLRKLDAFGDLLTRIEHLAASEEIVPMPLIKTVDADAMAVLPEAIEDLRRAHCVPGAVVSVLEHGHVVTSVAVGAQDHETGEIMTTDSLFRVDGAIDLFLAIALAQQHEAGAWTASNLMQQAYVEHIEMQRQRRGSQLAGDRTNVYAAPAWKLGNRRPSGFNARPLLTMALELVAEQSLTQYCREEIVERYGLSSPVFGRLRANQADRPPCVTGHSLFGTPLAPDRTPGLYLAPHDLASLFALMLAREQHDLSGKALLDILRDARRATPEGLGLALDLQSTSVGERVVLSTSQFGQGCVAVAYPRSGRGVVVTFNSEDGAAFAQDVARIVLGGE